VPVCPEYQAPIETWSTDRIVEAVLAAYAEQPSWCWRRVYSRSTARWGACPACDGLGTV